VFLESLDKLPHLAIIAEVKKASPSKGLIRPDFDPLGIALQYEEAGASAVSVLTDEKFFQGHSDYLVQIREKIRLPVLRKDFIIDPLQVEETAHLDADAMLLIAEALEGSQLEELYHAARELDIEPLIELHSLAQLDKVMRIEPPMIGINNRDLLTFRTDLDRTAEIARHIPKSIIVVSESGIHSATDAQRMREAGVRALLVGESLMRAQSINSLMKELML
jgi:indole-3-glycerol phosphate synthase